MVLCIFPNRVTGQCSVSTSATLDTVLCGGSVNLSAFGITNGTPIGTADFNNAALPAGWTCSQPPFWTNPCSPGGVDGSTHFWMGNGSAAPRSLTSAAFNLSSCTNAGVRICFDMLYMQQGGSAPCEGPDLPNEGVNFQYSINGGASWTTLNYFAPNGGNDPLLINWTNWCYSLPVAALTSNTRFRWFQAFSSDPNSDHWGIDNVTVYCNDPSYNIVWQHDGFTTGGAGAVNPTPVSPNVTTTYTAVMSNGTSSCSSSVTVAVRNPVVTVNAGGDVSICSGTCTQLNATARVVNCPAQNQTYTRNQFYSFSGNPNNFPINVSGFCSSVLQPNSIASVCISQIYYGGFAGFDFYDPDDISLTLTCPSGQTITLVAANTTVGSVFGNNGYVNACFVPSGASLAGLPQPVTGNWAPNQPFNNLAGGNANGTWSLGITTPAAANGGGNGILYGWSITFNAPEISYVPVPLWSPTTNMTNANTLTPTVCPPPNAYTLSVSDTGGCVTASDVVNVNTQSCCSLTANVVTAAPVCGNNNGGINITPVPPGSYTYAWSNGSTQQNQTALGAGTYTVTITNTANASCVFDTSISLTAINNPPVLSETHVNATCNNGNGSINLTVTGGAIPYGYVWSNGAATQDISNLNANTYTVIVTDANGCTNTLAVIISNNGIATAGTITANICPAQLPYSWNGNVYNAAGTYNVTLIGSSGCDSIATLVLDVSVNSTSTTTANICTAQLPYTWNGNVYNSAGTYTLILVNSSGCDSIATLILNVGANSTSTTTANICTAQLPYTWNGNVYNAAGTYNVTLAGSSGCDSIATLVLKVGANSTSTTTINICTAQLPYSWNGNVYNAAGTYDITLAGSSGCDSVATLILNVGANSTSTTTINICTAQLPYSWNGNVFNVAGTYNVTLIGSSGCDSIATLILNVGVNSTSTTTINICTAQLPYPWNGNVYNTAGTYNVTLIGSSGCDSVATLILNVGANSTGTTTINICPAALPYSWNGNVYNAAGTYNITLAGSSGCDSVATLILNVGANSTSTTTIDICTAALPYSWNGNVYNAAGTYNVTLINAAGCDSIATLVLNVGANSTGTTTINICTAQLPYTWNGNVYNAAGTYNVTLINSAGCDSVATLVLNVGANSTGTTTINICTAQLPYSWNGNVYNAAGTYSITLVGSSGCDSIATLVLNVGANSTGTTTINICTAQLSYTWNGNIYNVAGTYNVTLIGSSGCDSIATLILNVGANSTGTTTMNICTAQLPYIWNGNVYNAAGTYNVTLINAAGCDSVATLVLNVGANSTSTTPISICSSQLPYAWNGSVYPAAGNYLVILTGSNGCDSLASLVLTVKPTPPLPVVETPVTYCQYDPALPLIATVTGPVSQLLWYNSATGGVGFLNAFTPSVSLAAVNTYYVSQVANGCEGARAPITVTVNSKPQLPDSALNICYGQQANFNNLYDLTGLAVSWTIDQQAVPDPANISSAGIYQLLVANASGCGDTTTVRLSIQPPVVANAGPDAYAEVNVPYQLSGSGGIRYQWSPADRLTNAFIANPSATLMNDQAFILMALDEAGCFGLDTINLKVLKGPGFYVPNAFSPNNDAVNDIFRPVGIGIANIEFFRVFNRYGELIFETSEAGRGWDGTFKGKAQPVNTYVWMLRATDRLGKLKIMKGNVTLVR